MRVLDDDGLGHAYRVAAGIRYAIASGARVINLSLMLRQRANVVSLAILEAFERGVVVTAGTGNSGAQTLDFPASESAARVRITSGDMGHHSGTMLRLQAGGAR